MAYHGMQDAEVQDSKFLKQVHDAIDRRRIFWKRIAAVALGLSGIYLGPGIGWLAYRMWLRIGLSENPSQASGVLLGAILVAASIVLLVQAIDSDYHNKW